MSIGVVLALLVVGVESPNEMLVDFERRTLGSYTLSAARDDWHEVPFADLADRASIVERPAGGGRSLRIRYPAERVGSEASGGQFLVELPPADDYTLSYEFSFEPDFDFSRGGKLPGLVGGDHNTGGRRAEGDGWSARFMWREEGKLFAYVYHLDQASDYGDYLPLNVGVTRGAWHRIEQRVRVNSAEQADGVLQVWFDGKLVLDRQDMRFRRGELAPVDAFYFSTFFGGSTRDWAPRRESHAQFDNFRIRPTP